MICGMLTPSTIRSLVFQQLHYHRWRIRTLEEQLQQLNLQQLQQPTGGSFGSMEGLLRHLIYVDYLWLQRLNGSEKAVGVQATATNAGGYVQQWLEVADKLLHWATRVPDDALLQPLHYRTSDGNPLHNTPWEMVQHLVDHGSFHSGQLTHVLRDLGIAPAHTNWLYYYQDSTYRQLPQ